MEQHKDNTNSNILNASNNMFGDLNFLTRRMSRAQEHKSWSMSNLQDFNLNGPCVN
jgi:hypothetical protein